MKTSVKKLIGVVYSRNELTPSVKACVYGKLSRKTIDNSTITVRGNDGDFGYSLLVFDYYIIEQLSVLQYCRHLLRKFSTAVLDYVGINTVRIIIV